MNDCFRCLAVDHCQYPFKPCDCKGKHHYWSMDDRIRYDANVSAQRDKMKAMHLSEYNAIVERSLKK